MTNDMATESTPTARWQPAAAAGPWALKLDLGCGPISAPGWVGVDGSNRAWLASRLPWLDRLLVGLRLASPTEFSSATRWANLKKRFPWSDGSVDAIHMGEVLEHFTRDDGEHVVRECFRVLRPGGVLRIRVPDHARFWRNYLREYDAIQQRPQAEWNEDHSRWVQMYYRDICTVFPRLWQSMGHFHKWMYDDVSLVVLLTRTGFSEAARMPFHASRIPGIETVENRDDLIVEAVKP